MIQRFLRATIVALIIMLTFASVVLAAWEYRFPTTVIDTSNSARTYYPVLLGYGGQSLIDAGKINANGLDTNMEVGASDVGYMMATSEVPIALANLPSGGQVVSNLYTGYAPAQTSFPIIVGEGGYIEIADAAAIELGDDFDVRINGYWNTGGEWVSVHSKESAYATYISGTNEITSSILSGLSNISPTGFVDPDAAWANEADAYDGNVATGADLTTAAPANSWSSFIEFTIAARLAGGISYDAEADAVWTQIDVDVYSNGTWYDVFEGAHANLVFENRNFAYGYRVISAARVRFYNDNAAPQTEVSILREIEIREEVETRSVTAVAVADGEHLVTVTADTVDLKIFIDGGEEDSIALAGASVPDNGFAWALMDSRNDIITPYLEYYRHTVGAVEVIEYEPATMIQALTVGVAVDYPNVTASTSNTNASGVSHTINLPAGVGAGELLVAVLATTSNPTITWATGWTSLFATSQGANNTLAAAYRVATGGEGTSITVTTSAPVTSSAQSYIITNYQGVPVVGTATTGAAAVDPDPPNLTTGFGAVNTLWLAIAEDSVEITTYPAIYTKIAENGATPYLSSAFRQLNAASENPGTFTALAGNWVANTIGIEVAIPSQLLDLDAGDGVQNGVLVWGYNSYITIAYGEMESYESTTATATAGAGFTMPTSLLPDNWFAAGENVANLPFYDSFISVSTQIGMPVQTMYFWGIIGLAFGVALFLIIFTRSALFGVLGMVIVLFFGSSMTIIPMWIPFIVLVLDIGIMFLYRQVSY